MTAARRARRTARSGAVVRPVSAPSWRDFTVIAQDPSTRYQSGPKKGRIVTARVRVPAENLSPGPTGYRVQVVDYDATADRFYETAIPDWVDAYDDAPDAVLLSDPNFHCQNVYALVMKTLSRFEFALARRLAWGFERAHQLIVVPHAFAEANAHYSEEDRALLFGYFRSFDGHSDVFTCLSHDVVVHECTHALIDGLRPQFRQPSSPDQAAFHEGLSDLVALLSVFSLPSAMEVVLSGSESGLLSASAFTPRKLRQVVFNLALEVGAEISGIRGYPLRRALDLLPGRHYFEEPGFLEPHKRGEVLVAAMLTAFLQIWSGRVLGIARGRRARIDVVKAVEEGAAVADTLLTSAIRALDYTPPIDLTFADYLSAFLTADAEVRPWDEKLNLRRIVLESFRSYGIAPAAHTEDGMWEPPPANLDYGRLHHESLQRDPDEVFRFIWENRAALRLSEHAGIWVQSVRPCIRQGPDNFTLRETVVEYMQVARVDARELKYLGLTKPRGMQNDLPVFLHGGGTLIFDDFARLKYHIDSPLAGHAQNTRLRYLFQHGWFEGRSTYVQPRMLHRRRALMDEGFSEESW